DCIGFFRSQLWGLKYSPLPEGLHFLGFGFFFCPSGRPNPYIVASRSQFIVTVQEGSYSDTQTILNWVKNFKATASVQSKKTPGCPRTVRTPENEERVRVQDALLHSPWHSARLHSAGFGMSDRSVR
ncbi:hypothetical protein C0J52_07683, partial [Blattella germanica]